VGAEAASRWLANLGLEGLENHYPHELSGGQQRRVAIARALAVGPRLLLLDEPFTGLDVPVRDRLRRELRGLQRDADLTTVIVTHDPEEAALLAEEIIVLHEGRVLQAGTREAVFGRPCSPAAAAQLGVANARLACTVATDRIDCEGVELTVLPHGLDIGRKVMCCVAPERIVVGGDGSYSATLLDDADLGQVRELTLAFTDTLQLTGRTLERTPLTVGRSVAVHVAPEDIRLWPLEGS
jgi:molybdate transport system permease protein